MHITNQALSIKTQKQWKRWDSGPKVKLTKERALASLIPNPMIYAALVKELLSTESTPTSPK